MLASPECLMFKVSGGISAVTSALPQLILPELGRRLHSRHSGHLPSTLAVLALPQLRRRRQAAHVHGIPPLQMCKLGMSEVLLGGGWDCKQAYHVGQVLSKIKAWIKLDECISQIRVYCCST